MHKKEEQLKIKEHVHWQKSRELFDQIAEIQLALVIVHITT